MAGEAWQGEAGPGEARSGRAGTGWFVEKGQYYAGEEQKGRPGEERLWQDRQRRAKNGFY